MDSKLIWNEIHNYFDKLNEQEQVDKIARMLTKIREDKNEILKGDCSNLNKESVATLYLAQTMEDVLITKLGENGGALGDNFTIINENGNITIEEVK